MFCKFISSLSKHDNQTESAGTKLLHPSSRQVGNIICSLSLSHSLSSFIQSWEGMTRISPIFKTISLAMEWFLIAFSVILVYSSIWWFFPNRHIVEMPVHYIFLLRLSAIYSVSTSASFPISTPCIIEIYSSLLSSSVKFNSISVIHPIKSYVHWWFSLVSIVTSPVMLDIVYKRSMAITRLFDVFSSLFSSGWSCVVSFLFFSRSIMRSVKWTMILQH